MLYLHDKQTKDFRWHGIPLPECSKAIITEEVNGDYKLLVEYPISDTFIYQLFKEDMLISAPTPTTGFQFFRLKKPIEKTDHIELQCFHITEDIFKRSIKSMSAVQVGCQTALNSMISASKSDLGDFTFDSDIADIHTFNTKETETLYSVLLDGAHSIVGTWQGEMLRDNKQVSILKHRGKDRGTIISTHHNLSGYEREINCQGIFTRIHARSTYKESDEVDAEEKTISVTVDSPLIKNYPYINEIEYQNNNIKSDEELVKWANAKFNRQGLDKPSEKIKIEAYKVDGQLVHLCDIVTIKSRKHNADFKKKVIAYTYDSLSKEYIDFTFDDKVSYGMTGSNNGVAQAADSILATISSDANLIKLQAQIDNANRSFDLKEAKLREEIEDGIKKAESNAEVKVAEVNAKVLEAEKLAKEMDERLKEFLASADTKEQDFDKKLEEFRESLKELEVNEKQIDDALAKAGFSKDSLAEIKAKLEDTSETATVTANIVGSTGGTFYNRNRLDGDTDKVITFDKGYIDIAHNGEGFEEGKTYTISFEATCELLRKVGITVTQANMKGAHLVLTPKNPKLVVESFDLTKDNETINVYPFSYTVLVTSDWYKSKSVDLNTSKVQELALEMAYKEVVDGNNATITGAWSDSPQIILDGGNQ
ncbi:MAG: peptidase [Streptococcus pyogenes]|nr:MAG: peptidase [Streptococcus pyogenes]